MLMVKPVMTESEFNDLVDETDVGGVEEQPDVGHRDERQLVDDVGDPIACQLDAVQRLAAGDGDRGGAAPLLDGDRA